MEDRVRRLEGDMAEVRSDLRSIRDEIAGMRKEVSDGLSSVRTDIAYLRGRVENLPTTLQLLGFVIALFLAAGALEFFQQ